MSLWMMKGLLAAYVVIALACVWEKNWPKALYWFAAAQITAAVLMMK